MDATGARRLWPVKCHGMIDRAGLEQARDQLWAEAVHRYRAGHAWWLETPELEALAEAEQALRFVEDEWETIIREWLGNRDDVSAKEILELALGFSRQEWSEARQKRVGKILTHLGFTRHRPRKGDKRERRFRRDL